MSFTAKYSSDCEYCEVAVQEGDECQMLDYAKGLIAHVKCPDPPTPVQAPVCPKCWTTHAGTECY